MKKQAVESLEAAIAELAKGDDAMRLESAKLHVYAALEHLNSALSAEGVVAEYDTASPGLTL